MTKSGKWLLAISGALFIFAAGMLVQARTFPREVTEFGATLWPSPAMGASLTQAPVGTGFTYQGRLVYQGELANESFDFEFKLHDGPNADSQVGTTINFTGAEGTAVSVTNGLFTVHLDFGDVFDGTALWLEVWVKPSGSGDPFIRLEPRQPLTSTPYAIWSANAAALESRVQVLEALVEDMEQLSRCVTVVGQEVFFEGCNVHIRDGSGYTHGPTNASGNLIIGYNEDTLGDPNDRTGSHNLIIGPEHTYTSYGGLVAGFGNVISGSHASVSGGRTSTASGFASSVSGGVDNQASGGISSVSGGQGNKASNNWSSVSGGQANTASGSYSSVSGGANLTAGGLNHWAASCVLVAGQDVFFDGCNVYVRDGSGNTAGDTNGLGNLIIGYNEDILGDPNDRTGSHNLIIGPEHTYNSYGGLAAGLGNTISGRSSSVSGGTDNIASGAVSSVSGGASNEASRGGASVNGGTRNTAGGDYSWVGGGSVNTANGYAASVSGGGENTTSGDFSSVSGGRNRTAGNSYDWVAGGLSQDE